MPSILEERWPWVILAGLLLLYFVLKRDITDLKQIALWLFLGVLLFIVLLLVHMISRQNDWNHDVSPHSGYYLPFNEKQNKIRLVYCYTTLLVGCAFQSIFFPILNNLRNNSKPNVMFTCFIALMVAASIYTG